MSPLHDYNLANQTPASYRTDHNNLNLAIAGCNASSSGITTTYAHMLYADVSSSGWMRQRNAADSTFNYLWPLGVPGGIFTYSGSPSTNHACKFQGQPIYDTANDAYYIGTTVGTSSQATWAQVQFSTSLNTGAPKGYMHGLVPKYASAATFTISAGRCRDSGDAADIAISTAYTVDITVSGAGGLSTSETESTSGAWYYCFAMRKSGDGTVNFILTASSSGAVLPSGYDQTRLLPFAIRNTTQANFLPWWIGTGWPYRPTVRWDADFLLKSDAASGTEILTAGTQTSLTAVSAASFVPPISRVARFHASASNANTHLVLRETGVATGVNRRKIDITDSTIIVESGVSSSQSVDYLISAGSVDLAVYEYIVTEV